jgi:hypothetical protein
MSWFRESTRSRSSFQLRCRGASDVADCALGAEQCRAISFAACRRCSMRSSSFTARGRGRRWSSHSSRRTVQSGIARQHMAHRAPLKLPSAELPARAYAGGEPATARLQPLFVSSITARRGANKPITPRKGLIPHAASLPAAVLACRRHKS